ncbi:uncharacterized protein EV422DRAFT_192807 [Fimicolochytrium jonesii]|uniref:uncharacterized protein n=1 Tax=Fimicolochytrium jonesii TaxID=1396493 RepID=UPI0022FDFB12|nr:uncharacterized protein EV422DRAFT_192807 [Fimicolochytrium jonesii]KAI8818166.1 hypothetical protein EV422DRAFT_192807 [Fimicolochytrium jonesii]
MHNWSMMNRVRFSWLLSIVFCCVNAHALRILVIGDGDKSTQPYVELAWSGCPSAIAAYGNPATDSCTYDYKSASSDAGFLNNLRGYLNGTYGGGTYDHYVLISSKYAKQLPGCIKEFPNVKISTSSVSYPATSDYANVQGAIFSEDESGFLAGALAGLSSTSRIVGVIGGQPNTAVLKYTNGYVMGVGITCPSCRVLRKYATSFTSTSEGQAIAAEFIALGADIIFGAGGSTGSAGIQYAARKGVFVIGVDSDEGLALPFTNTSDIASRYILSSAMKRVDQSVLLSLKDRFAGNFAQTNRIMDATAGGVSLAAWRSAEASALMARTVPLIMRGSNNSCPITTYRTCADHLASIKQQLQGKAISTKISSTGLFTATSSATLSQTPGTWVELSGVFGMSPPDLEGATFIRLPGTNKAVLYGGADGTGALNAFTYLFDFDYRQWSVISDATVASSTKPVPRIQHVTAALDSKTIFVQGGRAGLGSNATLGDMWTLDIVTKTWTKLSMDLRLSGHAGALVENKLYMFGGVTADQKLSSDLYQHSFADGSLTTVLPASAKVLWPEGRQQATLTAINSTHMALFGGGIASGLTNSLHIYAIEGKEWIPVNPAGVAPAIEGHAAVLVDPHRILYIGGRTANSASPDTFFYNTVQGKWVFTESGKLPLGTNSPAAMTLVQAEAANACVASELPDALLCKPSTKPLVFVFGGSQQGYGATNAFYLSQPLDEVPPRPIVKLNVAMVAVLNLLASFGSLATVASMIGLIMFRKHPVVASASPAFAVLTTLGILLGHLSVFTHVNIGATKTGLTATIWLMSTGFIMSFAAMFVKTHRIYRIFNSKIRINLPQSVLLLRATAICAVVWVSAPRFAWIMQSSAQ